MRGGGLFEVGRASGTGREMDGRQQSMFGGELGNTDGMQGGMEEWMDTGGGVLSRRWLRVARIRSRVYVLHSTVLYWAVQCSESECRGVVVVVVVVVLTVPGQTHVAKYHR